MSGPPGASRPEQAPDKVPTDLVQEMCRNKIEPLTQAGAVSEGMIGIGAGAAFVVIGLAGGFFLLNDPISAEDASQSLAIFGFLGLLFLPLVPFLPYLFLVFAALGAGSLALGLARVSAAKAMGSSEYRCPACDKALSLTRSRRKLEFVCPECYTLIQASPRGSPSSRRCDYCGLTLFTTADAASACPSCRHKPGAAASACPRCKKAVRKNVLFCKECLAWLGVPETFLGSFTTETMHYDVGGFSPTACRAYIAELQARIAAFTEQLGKLAAAGPIPMEYATVVEIESSLHLLRKCALAAQWLYLKQERLPAEVVTRLAGDAQRIGEALETLRAANSLRERHEKTLWPIVKAARETFAAAERLPA